MFLIFVTKRGHWSVHDKNMMGMDILGYSFTLLYFPGLNHDSKLPQQGSVTKIHTSKIL